MLGLCLFFRWDRARCKVMSLARFKANGPNKKWLDVWGGRLRNNSTRTWWFKSWPFWDGEFAWPFLQGLLVTSNVRGSKRSRLESPGRNQFLVVPWYLFPRFFSAKTAFARKKCCVHWRSVESHLWCYFPFRYFMWVSCHRFGSFIRSTKNLWFFVPDGSRWLLHHFAKKIGETLFGMMINSYGLLKDGWKLVSNDLL